MSNSNYKPLISSGQGGSGSCIWVLSSTDKLPLPGDANKVYICKDTGDYRYWDDAGEKYRVLGSNSGKQQVYSGGRITFPPIGEEGIQYIDGITNESYFWNPNIGYPIFPLPNFSYNYTTGLPVNVLYKDGTGMGIVISGHDYGGSFSMVGFSGYYGPNLYVNFVDPLNPDSAPVLKTPYPIVATYDPDNPVIDLNNIEMQPVYGDRFIIFLPKSYDPTKWNSTNLDAWMRLGDYNYAFFVTDRVSGSYMKVED